MRNIVVGVQGTSEQESALDFALEEAVRRRLPLLVVHTYQLPGYGETTPSRTVDVIRDVRAAAHQCAAAALDRAKERVPGGWTASTRLSVLESDPSTALLSVAGSAALLVVGSRGTHSVASGRLGSVSAACLRRAWAPVVVVPNDGRAFYDKWLTSRVVVALDGSPASLTALTWATAQAREWGCSLSPIVVSATYDELPIGMRTQVRVARRDLTTIVAAQVADAGGADLEVHPRLLLGEPSEQLLAVVDPADLLVMGSRARGAVASLLLGSTSMSVAERALCPVVVVRNGQARREIHQRAPYASSR
jgi:nucleotide-binding universal stress UspA family protein